jgi:hypothetical protein
MDTDLDLILDCLPTKDRASFAARFIQDKVEGIVSDTNNLPLLHLLIRRLVVPQQWHPPPQVTCQRKLVKYHVPLDKACPPDDTYFPQNSVMDPSILVRPASPQTPFEFLFDMLRNPNIPGMDKDLLLYEPMDSVTRVVGLPRVCGLKCDNDMVARVTRLAVAMDALDNPSLMDRGTNICITGILSILVDGKSIPPLPISVATTSGSISLDDCCMKRGLLPLTLADSSVYYPPCYYCKNATERIILPKAIVAASNTLVHWTQTGHKGADPRTIHFSSNSGLYSITIALKKQDGLYYCPTDVFTVDWDPVRPPAPIIRRAIAPPPADRHCRSKCFTPVTHNRLTESEVWMLRLGSPGKDQLDLLPGNVTGVPPGFQYHPFCFLDWKEEARIQKQAAL